jgi:hypothetical protein
MKSGIMNVRDVMNKSLINVEKDDTKIGYKEDGTW